MSRTAMDAFRKIAANRPSAQEDRDAYDSAFLAAMGAADEEGLALPYAEQEARFRELCEVARADIVADRKQGASRPPPIPHWAALSDAQKSAASLAYWRRVNEKIRDGVERGLPWCELVK